MFRSFKHPILVSRHISHRISFNHDSRSLFALSKYSQSNSNSNSPEISDTTLNTDSINNINIPNTTIENGNSNSNQVIESLIADMPPLGIMGTFREWLNLFFGGRSVHSQNYVMNTATIEAEQLVAQSKHINLNNPNLTSASSVGADISTPTTTPNTTTNTNTIDFDAVSRKLDSMD